MRHSLNTCLKAIPLLVLFASVTIQSQTTDSPDLSKINFCQLSVDDLMNKDPELKEVKLEEMDLCADGFIEDDRYVNRTGYESKLYPGVIFQQYKDNDNVIAKIHLTKEFKGYLPDGNYVDLKKLKAEDILKKYDSLDSWTSRGCSDYWGIKKENSLKFYVKIKKDKEPRYPVDIPYYSKQPIEGIDIISDCNSFNKKNIKIKPLYIVDGKEVTEAYILGLDPQYIDSVNVLKDTGATGKYGDKGKNGVIEINLKKQ